MKEILPDIDKLFKEAVEQHSDVPGKKVWDAIENDLDKKKVIHISKSYDRLKQIAIILLLLLGSTITYLLIDSNNHPSEKQMVNGSKSNETVPALQPATNHKIDNSSNSNLGSIAQGKTPNKTENSNIQRVDSSDFSDSKTTLAAQNTEREERKNGNIKEEITSQAKKHRNSFNKSLSIFTFNPQAENIPGQVESNSSSFNHTKQVSKENNLSVENNNEAFNYSFNSLEPLVRKDYFNSFPTVISTRDVQRTSYQTSKVVNSKSKSKNGKGLSLSAFYSPDISFNQLRNDKPHDQDADRHHLKDNEKHSFSFTSGINVALPLNKKLSLQTGIALSQSSVDNQPKNVTAERDQNGQVKYRFDASCGFGYFLPKNGPPPNIGDTLKGVSAHNQLKYLQIPISLIYNTGKGKLSFTSSAGVALNHLVSGSISTTVVNPTSSVKESQTISTVEGLKKNSLTGLIGVGLEYKLTKNILFQFIPTGRIALSSINNGSSVKSYPGSLGLSTGVRIHL